LYLPPLKISNEKTNSKDYLSICAQFPFRQVENKQKQLSQIFDLAGSVEAYDLFPPHPSPKKRLKSIRKLFFSLFKLQANLITISSVFQAVNFNFIRLMRSRTTTKVTRN
jgi:hypothetical protein